MAFRAFLLSTIVAALATSVTANIPPKSFVDTFEDKPVQLPAGVGTPVGIENGLYYQSWQVGTAQPSLTAPGTYSFGGVQPKSKPNVAFAGAITEVTNATVAITANYAGSNVTKFDLLYMYIGCAAFTDETVADVASGCSLSVSGYYPGGAMIPGYTMSFGVPLVDLTTLAPLPAQLIVFPISFLNVQTVVIQVAAFGGPNSEDAVYFVDNVAHVNYYS